MRLVFSGLVLALVSCSQPAGKLTADRPSGAVAEATTGSILVLYKDKAFIRYSRDASFGADGTALLSNVPIGEQTQVRSAGGEFYSIEHALAGSRDANAQMQNREVVAVTKNGIIRGRVLEMSYLGISIKTSDGVSTPREAILGLRQAEPQPASLPGTVLIRGGTPGPAVVEVGTWIEGVAWRVAYTIVLDGLEADEAWLQGWLSIDSAIAQSFAVDQVAVVDGRSSKLAGDEQWPGYDSYYYYNRGQTPPRKDPEQPRAPVSLLARGVSLHGGASVRLPLLSQRRAPIKLARVFDPIGTGTSHEGATPVLRKAFGTEGDHQVVPVSLSVQIGLPEEELAELPAGDASVFARVEGEVVALGATKAFSHQATSVGDMVGGGATEFAAEGEAGDMETGDAYNPYPPAEEKKEEIKLRPGELRVGVANGLSGRRWQEDFSLDRQKKRLVEELRVEIVNDSDEDADVLVNEHMYRGLNWSLAYHNGVGVPAKAGAQEVSFTLTVAKKSKSMIMYRVVYSWE